jgi:hypothetical protein
VVGDEHALALAGGDGPENLSAVVPQLGWLIVLVALLTPRVARHATGLGAEAAPTIFRMAAVEM